MADHSKTVHSLFDGIYDSSKPCLFCDKLCGNKCAVKIIEKVFECNNASIELFDKTTEEDCLQCTLIFLNLLIRTERYCREGFIRGDKRKYMIYALISYLSRSSVLETIISKRAFFMEDHIKKWINEYHTLSEKDEHCIYSDTPFLNNLEYILTYLENRGPELKHW